MSRVFVVQCQHHQDRSTGQLVPKFDLTTAAKYGELIYLLSPTARPFDSKHVIGEMREKLYDFRDEDYLLLIGNPALIGFAVAIASCQNSGHVNVLQWDGRKQQYIPIEAYIGPREDR